MGAAYSLAGLETGDASAMDDGTGLIPYKDPAILEWVTQG